MPNKSLTSLLPSRINWLSLLLVTLLAASAPAFAEQEVQHGPIRIGIFPLEPINYIDKNGQGKGFNPALLEKIAAEENWQIIYVPGSWAEGLERLQSHDIEIMMSVGYSDERAKVMDYTYESALDVWGQLYVRPDDQGTAITDLNGKRIGLMRRDLNGQNFKTTAANLGIKVSYSEYPDFADIFAAVQKGELAGGVAPNHFGLRHAKDFGLVASTIQFSPFPIHFTAKKGQHHQLLSKIDAHLFRWKQNKNSYYYQQLRFWLGSGPAGGLPVWAKTGGAIGAGVLLLSVLLSILFKYQVRLATCGLKEANAELAASREEYRFLYVNAQGGLCKIRIDDGKILECNQKFAELLGYAGREDCLRKCFLTDHYVDGNVWPEIVGSVQDDGQAPTVEAEFKRCDGKDIWLRLASKADLEKTSFDSVAIDISFNKTIEKTLLFTSQESWFLGEEQVFSSLVCHLGESLGVEYAFVGRIQGQSRKIRTLGLYAEGQLVEDIEYDLLDTPCDNVFGSETCIYPAGVQEMFPRDHLLVEMQVEAYAGAPLWNAAGEPIGLLVVLSKNSIENQELVETVLQLMAVRAAHEMERIDYLAQLQERNAELLLEIEQRNRFASELRESEQQHASLSRQFEALLDAISDPLALLTPGMKLLWTNQAYEQVCRELQVADGMTLFHLDTSGRPSPVLNCLKRGVAVEDMMTTPDQRTWGVKAYPLVDEHGLVRQVIVSAADITEKIRLREEANRSNRLAALGELAAGIAHEINNPNAVILLNAPIIKEAFADIDQLLEEGLLKDGPLALAGIELQEMRSELPQLIERIEESGQRIRRIVEDLKNFVRDEGNQELNRVDLNEVVSAAIRLLQNSIKQATDNFSESLAENLPLVRGDFQKLEQVVINLIHNACQALTERGQQVQVTTSFQPETGRLLLEVRDQGIGVEDQQLERLTDPFYTTKRASGGTGLGLAVSDRILQEHQAQLQVRSKPGEGSVFSVSIPAWKEGSNG